MSETDLRDFYRRYVEAANAREFDRMDEFIDDEPALHGVPGTRDAVVADLKSITDAVPDFHWKVSELIVNGDRLAARLVARGTPVKDWIGVAPTGGSFEIVEHSMYRVQNGRFVQMSNLFYVAELKRQLAG